MEKNYTRQYLPGTDDDTTVYVTSSELDIAYSIEFVQSLKIIYVDFQDFYTDTCLLNHYRYSSISSTFRL